MGDVTRPWPLKRGSALLLPTWYLNHTPAPSSLHRSKHETAALVENRPVLRLIKRGQSVGGKRRINWQRAQQSVSERQEERMSEKDGEEEKRENRGLSTDYIRQAMHQTQRESEGNKREVI